MLAEGILETQPARLNGWLRAASAASAEEHRRPGLYLAKADWSLTIRRGHSGYHDGYMHLHYL